VEQASQIRPHATRCSGHAVAIAMELPTLNTIPAMVVPVLTGFGNVTPPLARISFLKLKDNFVLIDVAEVLATMTDY